MAVATAARQINTKTMNMAEINQKPVFCRSVGKNIDLGPAFGIQLRAHG
jgi:hypothetical protein